MDDKKVSFNTTVSKKLLKEIKFLAVRLDKRLNQLHEEALKDILKKYSKS